MGSETDGPAPEPADEGSGELTGLVAVGTFFGMAALGAAIMAARAVRKRVEKLLR